jgi:hypothetical protein
MLKFLLVWFVSFGIFANEFEDGFEDEFSDEFSDEFANIEVKKVAEKQLYGSIDFETIYNYNSKNPHNISSNKLLLDLIFDKKTTDYKFYANLKGYYDAIYSSSWSDYDTTPKDYEHEINLNEAYISGKINDNLDFKIGKQIVVWGKSDNIRITDILNPLDNRLPGLVDIKNLRLGKFISKFDYYNNDINYSLAILNENNFSKNPKFGSDFTTSANSTENKPNDSLKNTGVGLSITGSTGASDYGIYFANTYIDKPYFENGALQFDDKINMLGGSINKVVDSYLFKFEVAFFDKIKYSGLTGEKSRFDTLFGVEYSGITDGSLSYELALRNINNFENAINTVANQFTKKETYQQSIRFTQNYLNQTLDLTAIISLFGKKADDGGFVRVSLDYDIDDNISMSGGFIDYLGGSTAFDGIKNNDRIFTKISYSF